MLGIHLISWLLAWWAHRRRRREAAPLEALERAEAAADRALFSADPGFAAELGYQPAPFPEAPPMRTRFYDAPSPDALRNALAGMMQAQQAPNPLQLQQMAAMQQGAFGGLGAGMLGGLGSALGSAGGLGAAGLGAMQAPRCTCGAPGIGCPTFHHGYCAIWQRKA